MFAFSVFPSWLFLPLSKVLSRPFSPSPRSPSLLLATLPRAGNGGIGGGRRGGSAVHGGVRGGVGSEDTQAGGNVAERDTEEKPRWMDPGTREEAASAGTTISPPPPGSDSTPVSLRPFVLPVLPLPGEGSECRQYSRHGPRMARLYFYVASQEPRTHSFGFLFSLLWPQLQLRCGRRYHRHHQPHLQAKRITWNSSFVLPLRTLSLSLFLTRTLSSGVCFPLCMQHANAPRHMSAMKPTPITVMKKHQGERERQGCTLTQ